jgi:hypothetical protein
VITGSMLSRKSGRGLQFEISRRVVTLRQGRETLDRWPPC